MRGRREKMQAYHKNSRFIKMAVVSVSVVTLLLGSSLPAFAETTHQQATTPQVINSSVTVKMTKHTVVKPGIHPDITITGDGGVAKLNWMASYQGLNWAVEPSGLLPGFEFIGDIIMNYSNGVNLNIPVSGIGVLGTSDTVPVTIYHGTGFNATLVGVATDAIGDTATVNSGCSVYVYTP